MGLIVGPSATPQLDNLGTTAINAQLNMVTGSTTVVPFNVPAQTEKTSPAQGDFRQDVNSLLFNTATGKGIIPSVSYAILAGADFTLADSNADQVCFPAATDLWTLQGSTTYEFYGLYYITSGAVSHSVAIGFTLGGGASITSILYACIGWPVAINTATATQTATMITQVATTAVNQAGANAVQYFWFKGHIRMNAGGTVQPIIKFSAAPGSTNLMKQDSFIKFIPIGTNTVASVGPVA
jgi:hypothetical protein